MKLYLLRPMSYDSHWDPWCDKSFGFVVRAESEERAREIAAENSGYEGEDAWTNPEFSICVELTTDGEEDLIMEDFHAS